MALLERAVINIIVISTLIYCGQAAYESGEYANTCSMGFRCFGTYDCLTKDCLFRLESGAEEFCYAFPRLADVVEFVFLVRKLFNY